MRNHMKERFGGDDNIVLTPPLPNSLNIELNNTCNHKCIFCGYHGKYGKVSLTPSVLEIEFVKRVLDESSRLGIGSKEVGFYLSGEAFLYNDLAEVISYASAKGFKYIFITTNGALAIPEKMKQVVDSGLSSIRFSINGSDRETYKEMHCKDDFDNVVRNLQWLSEYREKNHIDIGISISCVLTKKTKDIEKRMRDCFERYVDDMIFLPVQVDELRKSDYIDKEIRLVDDTRATINKDYVCPIVFNTMYISSDGNVVPCCKAPGTGVSFANLKEDFDLEKAWYGEEYKRYRLIFLEDGNDDGTLCKNCIMRKYGINRLTTEEL